MNGLLKRSIVAALVLVNLGAFVVVARAAGNVTGGLPVNVFADPNDFVVELDTAGMCGSRYFHILRANANFKEMTAVALTAFSVGKRLTFFVASCNSDRNIISHGYASR